MCVCVCVCVCLRERERELKNPVITASTFQFDALNFIIKFTSLAWPQMSPLLTPSTSGEEISYIYIHGVNNGFISGHAKLNKFNCRH